MLEVVEHLLVAGVDGADLSAAPEGRANQTHWGSYTLPVGRVQPDHHCLDRDGLLGGAQGPDLHVQGLPLVPVVPVHLQAGLAAPWHGWPGS